MTYSLIIENIDNLSSSWNQKYNHLKGNSIFIYPGWLKVWWQQFGAGELYLSIIREDDHIIGFAPLVINNATASFVGSPDVCDYLDFLITPGRERDFFYVLCLELQKKGIRQLNLNPVREDSNIYSHLLKIAEQMGYQTSSVYTDVSLEIELPSDWNTYLNMLNTKQRHEVRRKLNRLYEAGKVNYYTVGNDTDIAKKMDLFLKMFRESRREEKANFMTVKMEAFFRSFAESMPIAHLLRMGILELDGLPVASVLSFIYNNREYLYNSAYYPQFSNLSVGLMAKVLHIKDSIEQGRSIYDFLKGAEPYKYRLGGTEKRIYNCGITLYN